jgi:hypothetical protein
MSAPPGQNDPRPGLYDPELPFLHELERDLRRSAERAMRVHGHRPTERSAARPRTVIATSGATRRRGSLPRVARRSLTLVALLCLIGASAYGASQALSGSAPNPTVVRQGAFVSVTAGHAGSDRWSLRLYSRGAGLCRVLVVAETESSRCAPPPGSNGLGVTSVVSPLRRYLFGVTGSAVARVSVRAGDTSQIVTTHPLDSTRARAAGLPVTTRWFVAIVRRPVGGPEPAALVSGLDSAGKRMGLPRVDCAETTQRRRCPG